MNNIENGIKDVGDTIGELKENLSASLESGNLAGVLQSGYYINSTTGQMIASATYASTDFIPVDGYAMLKYSRPIHTLAMSVAGLAFYSGRTLDDYISGQAILLSGSSKGYRDTQIAVPKNAVFVRITFWADASIGTPYVYGTVDAITEINRIGGAVANDGLTDLMPYNYKTYTENNVTFTSDGTNGYYISSSGVSTGVARKDVFALYNDLPRGVIPGYTYEFDVDNDTDADVVLSVVAYKNNASASPVTIIYANTAYYKKIRCTIPSDTTGLGISLQVPFGVTISGTHWRAEMRRVIASLSTDAVDMLVSGMYSFRDAYGINAGLINANNALNASSGAFVLISVKGHKNISVKASTMSTVVCMIRGIPVVGEDIPFTYARDEDGYIIYENGLPVVDRRRYSIQSGKQRTLSIQSDCKYLYMHIGTPSDPYAYMPQYLALDDIVLIKNDDAVDRDMCTVFFDDFDGTALSTMWTKITNSPGTMLTHSSMYHTDDDDCWVSNGCMVLSVCPGDGIDLGGSYQYDPQTGQIIVDEGGTPILAPRTLKSGYVSTHEHFAIKKGAISAKIRLGQSIESGFPWTFFTFGHNAPWLTAPEFDIVEGTVNILTESVTTKDGTTYPPGSLLYHVASHTHYLNSENQEGIINGSVRISYKNPTSPSADEKFNRFGNYNETDWHIYKVTWDDKWVTYYIDDIMVNSIDLSSLNSQTIFTSPADVRLNIKARPWCNSDKAFMFVDWIRVESFDDVQPPTSISHPDVTLSVNDVMYISPTILPATAQNQAFDMETDDTDVIQIMNDTPNYEIPYHRITGLSAGTATVKITTQDGHCSSVFTVTVI